MSVEAMGSPKVELPDAVDVAIVGGGIMGLSIAYNLAGLQSKDANSIAVLERGYLVSGASGRNGGGVRMQWGDEGNVRLMMESIEICRGLAQDLNINLWFRQGGYLFLARNAAVEERLVRNHEVHREAGAPTRLVTPREARQIVPALDVSNVTMAAYNPEDGVVFPWPFVWGYAARAVERGVLLRTHTKVSGVEPLDQGFRLHLSTGETLRARRVVNATGAWSVELNRAMGIDLPNHPHRHEILSSEPLKPFLDPLVADLHTGLYFSQSTRGEIVTGITVPDPPGASAAKNVDMRSSLRFLAHVARTMAELMPMVRHLRPLRQWAGPYDISPDGDPIVGPSPDHPDFIQVCGFMGHGFMMAPIVGRLVAEWMAGRERHAMFDRWDPTRFRDGRSIERREDMNIG